MLKGLFSGGAGAGNVRMVEPSEVKAWFEAGTVVVVDVREPDEYAAGHIPGALNLPLSVFDPARMPAAPEGKQVVLHCRSGVRCGKAAEKLVAAGHRGQILRMAGGITAWGGPITTD